MVTDKKLQSLIIAFDKKYSQVKMPDNGMKSNNYKSYIDFNKSQSFQQNICMEKAMGA